LETRGQGSAIECGHAREPEGAALAAREAGRPGRAGLDLGVRAAERARLVELAAHLPAADAEHAEADRADGDGLEHDRLAHVQRRARVRARAEHVLDENEDEAEPIPAVSGVSRGGKGMAWGTAHPKKRSAEDASAFRVNSIASSSETGRSVSEAQPMTAMIT
jgi:hypothetical protein